MELKVLPAEEKDSGLIRELAAEVWYHTYEKVHTREQLEYMFEKMYAEESLRQQVKEGHRFFILYRREEPIGYASLQQKEADLFYLQKFYLTPVSQGIGAGKYLFYYILSVIQSIHPAPSVLELNVNRSNPAIQFYKRMGMEIIRESDDEIGEGFVMNNCFMQLKIS